MVARCPARRLWYGDGYHGTDWGQAICRFIGAPERRARRAEVHREEPGQRHLMDYFRTAAVGEGGPQGGALPTAGGPAAASDRQDGAPPEERERPGPAVGPTRRERVAPQGGAAPAGRQPKRRRPDSDRPVQIVAAVTLRSLWGLPEAPRGHPSAPAVVASSLDEASGLLTSTTGVAVAAAGVGAGVVAGAARLLCGWGLGCGCGGLGGVRGGASGCGLLPSPPRPAAPVHAPEAQGRPIRARPMHAPRPIPRGPPDQRDPAEAAAVAGARARRRALAGPYPMPITGTGRGRGAPREPD